MDVAGAKALRERLARNGAKEAPPAGAAVDIPEDAPPVFHWLGVSRPAAPAPAAEEDEPPAAASLFRRLGLSSR